MSVYAPTQKWFACHQKRFASFSFLYSTLNGLNIVQFKQLDDQAQQFFILGNSNGDNPAVSYHFHETGPSRTGSYAEITVHKLHFSFIRIRAVRHAVRAIRPYVFTYYTDKILNVHSFCRGAG